VVALTIDKYCLTSIGNAKCKKVSKREVIFRYKREKLFKRK